MFDLFPVVTLIAYLYNHLSLFLNTNTVIEFVTVTDKSRIESVIIVLTHYAFNVSLEKLNSFVEYFIRILLYNSYQFVAVVFFVQIIQF